MISLQMQPALILPGQRTKAEVPAFSVGNFLTAERRHTAIIPGTVDQGGRGIVTANMQNVAASPGCAFLAPPPAVGDKSTFEIRFGIQGDGCLQVIGTALVPEGGTPIPIVIQGQACPQ